MKKKRIMILIALAILLAYLASLFVVFGASKNIVSDDLDDFVLDFANVPPMEEYFEGYTTQDVLNEMMYREVSDSVSSEHVSFTSNASRNEFPYAAAVYDREGNLVVKSGSMIKVYSGGGSERKSQYCYLDEYLTSGMKKDIVSFFDTKAASFKADTDTCVFDFNIENNKIVPVKLYFKNSYTEEELTLKFSDKKAEYTSDWIDICFVDVKDSHYNHILYKGFYVNIESDWVNDWFEKIEKGEDNHYSWKELSGEDAGVSSFYPINIRGAEEQVRGYYLYEMSAFRPILGTINSEVFKTFFIQETILFAVIGIALLLATGIIFNKNERLEKSRLAFTSAAAHELKTPLAVISNQCECIIENVVPEKNGEYVRSIYDETRRMNKLVATLLQYNRINSLKNISRENVDMSGIINAELQKYDALIKDKNIETQVDAKEGINVKCNAELIGLVVDNFLSNAIKHSPENGLIKLSAKPEKNKVKVTVFNKGSAIKREDAKHIWEEFYREDKARNSKDNSTGMGLAISKRILELHKFKYGFKNTNGGVEFSFTAK
ncbi:MAG: HAMP domain-containing histidine kinase [Clostridia bacterium]|nr:HAMP domain-containing histidine kinase [Clostridia bacterium]